MRSLLEGTQPVERLDPAALKYFRESHWLDAPKQRTAGERFVCQQLPPAVNSPRQQVPRSGARGRHDGGERCRTKLAPGTPGSSRSPDGLAGAAIIAATGQESGGRDGGRVSRSFSHDAFTRDAVK